MAGWGAVGGSGHEPRHPKLPAGCLGCFLEGLAPSAVGPRLMYPPRRPSGGGRSAFKALGSVLLGFRKTFLFVAPRAPAPAAIFRPCLVPRPVPGRAPPAPPARSEALNSLVRKGCAAVFTGLWGAQRHRPSSAQLKAGALSERMHATARRPTPGVLGTVL